MIKKLLGYSSPEARRLLVAELALVVVTAVLQGIAFLLLVPLLRALFLGDLDTARFWLLVLAAIGVVYVIAYAVGSQIAMKASTAVLDSLLTRLGDRLVELPIAWFGADRSGQMAHIATQGAMFVSSTPYSIVRLILTGFITPGTVLIGMFFFDWRLATAMAASVPVMWFVFRWLSGGMGRSDAEHVEAVHEASNRVIEFARVQPTLRTAGEGSIADRLVEESLQHQHRAYKGLLVTGGAGIATFAGIVQLALTAIIVLGAYLALGGSLDVATLIALLVLGVRFVEPISHSGALGGGVAVAQTTLRQLDELMALEGLAEPAAPAEPEDWSIEFDGVTFGYGGAPDTSTPRFAPWAAADGGTGRESKAMLSPYAPASSVTGTSSVSGAGSAAGAVLRDLSFRVPSGTMTAIVGPSGSGKTTITKLIARFYDPEAGTVSIGGRTLQELGTAVVEGAVAPVFQDVYLFDDTILNNIWIGNPSLGRDEVIAAASRARVDEIVERLPGGWEARVGEGGSNLSGGERQRVSIARALLKDAPIVLLDEATAALDIGNEIAIGEAVDAMRADRTVVVVAHRLQTVMTADQIVMLDGEGGILERGTHAELLAADGAYARYWRERIDATSWQLAGGEAS